MLLQWTWKICMLLQTDSSSQTCGCGCGFSDWGILVCIQRSHDFPKNRHFFLKFHLKYKQSSSTNCHLEVRADKLLCSHLFLKHINYKGDESPSPPIPFSLVLPLSSGTSWASWTTRNWCEYKKIKKFNLSIYSVPLLSFSPQDRAAKHHRLKSHVKLH